MTITLDEWSHQTRMIVEALGPTLGPDDDWMPTALLLKGDELTVAAIDPEFMSSAANKEQLGNEVLPTLVQDTGADAFAMVATIWQTEIGNTPYDRARVDPETGQPRVPVSLLPDRVESVLVTVVNAEGVGGAVADITRTPGAPPELGDWTDLPSSVFGRLVDGVKAVFGHTDPPPDPKEIFK